jgi:hypothetical protein
MRDSCHIQSPVQCLRILYQRLYMETGDVQAKACLVT